MENLVLSNVFYRKTRTAATVFGVALGMILIVLTVGLVQGFLDEQGRRNSAVTAEIMFSPPGDFSLGLSGTLSIPENIADELREMEGVRDAVPVANMLREGRMVDGVDFEAFQSVSDIRIVEGRAIQSGDEVVVDAFLQRTRKVKVGDQIQLFDRPFNIVGVYEPESLARLKVPIDVLQGFLNREGLCAMILVKLDDPSRQEEIAATIQERFPQNDIRLTRDLPLLYARGTPAMHTFIRVVVGLSIIVSSLIVLLTMYTTVAERTRQIGILKSLGASKAWIAGEIEKEALVISALGVVTGLILSFVGKFIMEQFLPFEVELIPRWFLLALVLSMLSGAVGALYPALRAANEDPVKALSYE